MTRLPSLCLALLVPALASAAPAPPGTTRLVGGAVTIISPDGWPFSGAQEARPADAASAAVGALMADVTTAGSFDQSLPAAFSRPADAVRAPDRSGQVGDTRGTIAPLAIPEPGSLALASLALALLYCGKRPLRG